MTYFLFQGYEFIFANSCEAIQRDPSGGGTLYRFVWNVQNLEKWKDQIEGKKTDVCLHVAAMKLVILYYGECSTSRTVYVSDWSYEVQHYFGFYKRTPSLDANGEIWKTKK